MDEGLSRFSNGVVTIFADIPGHAAKRLHDNVVVVGQFGHHLFCDLRHVSVSFNGALGDAEPQQ
jgi:hypothetical protein